MPASMETLSTQKTFLIISATGVDTLVIRPLEWYQLSHTRPYSSTLTPFVQNPVVNFGQLLFGSKKVTFPHETLLSLHLWHSLPFRLLDPTFQTRAILRQKSQDCIFMAPALLYRTLLSTLPKMLLFVSKLNFGEHALAECNPGGSLGRWGSSS